jgi:DNA-binding FrmR family transcriptional regulator
MKEYLTYTPRGYKIISMKKDKQKLIRRLQIIEGQVRGLQAMIKDDKYCIDVITQTSAVKQALSGIEDILMEGHLGSCLVHQIQKGQVEKATKEILRVYGLKRK